MTKIIIDYREDKKLVRELTKKKLNVERKQLLSADVILETKNSEGRIETVGIEIIAFETKDYQIRPNPIVSTSQLLFNNEKNKEAQIHIYDAKGNAFPILTTRTNVVNINAESFNSGFYFFNVVIDNQLVTSGKFIVQ